MGIYTREELAENPGLGREESGAGEVASDLHSRLTQAQAHNGEEGYRHGHVDSELNQIAGGVKEGEILPPVEEGDKSKKKSKSKDKPSGGGEQAQGGTMAERAMGNKADDKAQAEASGEPTDATGYADYARAWIAKAKKADDLEARWDGERELRAACKVGVSLRKALEHDAYEPKLAELRRSKAKR